MTNLKVFHYRSAKLVILYVRKMPEYRNSKDRPNRVIRAFRDTDGFDGYLGLYAGNQRLKALEMEEANQMSDNSQSAGRAERSLD